MNVQPNSHEKEEEIRHTDNNTQHQSSHHTEVCILRTNTPSLPSPDPVVVHTQRTPSPIRPFRAPPLPPKANTPRVTVETDKAGKESLPERSQATDKLQTKAGCGDTETMKESVEWPPPYEIPDLDILSRQAEKEIMDLPVLPPPPPCYPEQFEQRQHRSESPGLKKEGAPETRCHSPHRSASPLIAQIKPFPKPPVAVDIQQKKISSSKLSSCTTFSSSYSSPRLAPPKPSKFPVSLYVPAPAGDRRPSNVSQYDNLSEADEDERCAEKLLASTPEETFSVQSNNGDFAPAVHPPSAPPVFIPPSPSLTPSSLYPSTSLPQEPEYGGDTSMYSDTQKAASPSYHKPFSRGRRNHSAFPAPLLYTGSPPGNSRPLGQSTVRAPLVQPSPGFCRMPPGGQQLPKSVTF